jgi:hypothetical protein
MEGEAHSSISVKISEWNQHILIITGKSSKAKISTNRK